MRRDLSGIKLGQYEVRDQLGRGGMAEVYRAYQPGMDRFVAIKMMLVNLADSEEFVERFRREARAVGSLRHSNIVNVFDFGVENDMYYMVMEYLQGKNLKAYINEKGKLPPLEALSIASQLADALSYAHGQGMIHRDLKPANVLFSDAANKQAVLTDFGIARILGQTGLTESGMMVGTPAYISPEAAQGLDIDERADIYALGIMLYEMLTGKVPYDADTPLAVVMKHINAPLPTRQDYGEDIPPEVEAIILRSLTKDPADRYANAAEMKSAINAAGRVLSSGMATQQAKRTRSNKKSTQADEFPATVVDDTPQPKKRRIRATRRQWIMATVAALIVVVVLGILVDGGSDNNEAEATADITALGSIRATLTAAAPTTNIDAEATDGEVEVETEGEALPEVEPQLLSGVSEFQDEVDALLLENRVDEARERIDAAIDEDAESPEAWFARASLQLREGNAEAAAQIASEMIERAPDRPVGYLLQSDVFSHWSVENPEGALEMAATALELSPDNPHVLWRLARAMEQTDDWEGAYTTLEEAIKNGAHGIDFITYAGEFFYYAGEPQRAIPYLQAWHDSGFRDPYSMQLLTGALLATDNVDRAHEVISNFPWGPEQPWGTQDANAMADEAYVALLVDDVEAADQLITTALVFEPENLKAHYVDALIDWWAEGDYEEALDIVDMLIDEGEFYGDPFLTPQFGRSLMRDRADILVSMGDYEEAQDTLDELLEQDDWRWDIYADKAEIYLLDGENDEAAEALRNAIERADDSEVVEFLVERLREIAPEDD